MTFVLMSSLISFFNGTTNLLCFFSGVGKKSLDSSSEFSVLVSLALQLDA